MARRRPAEARAVPPVPRFRVVWRVAPLLAGLLLGACLLVLLQQQGRVVATSSAFATALGFGLACGLLLPTLAYNVSARWAARRAARRGA